MRVERFISIGNIVMDHWPLNPSTLDLVAHLRTGGGIPPIKVQLIHTGPKAGSFKIRDGRHRVTAYKLLGYENIWAKYGVNYGIKARYKTMVATSSRSKTYKAAQGEKGL